MASRKNREVIVNIETQEDFDQKVLTGGQMAVVDAYPKWTGSVKAVKPLFKKAKIDSGNDALLGFFTACIDDIGQLEPYRDSIPEPLFLVFSGGELVYRQRGCNAPLLERKIVDLLALEHKIQESEDSEEPVVRMPIPNCEAEHLRRLSQHPMTAGLPASRAVSRNQTVVKPDRTFGILKPGALEHKNEILEALEKEGITLYTYKEQNPDSLRAKYGTTKITNGLHAADSKEAAAREMAFFFPDEGDVERTIALIRPGVLEEFGEEIVDAIRNAGFVIADRRAITLTREQAEGFYSKHKGEAYFEPLINIMTGGICHAFLLCTENAVSRWRDLLGPVIIDEETKEKSPDSFRVKFQTSSSVNSLHGSSSHAELGRDIACFFPEHADSVTFGVVKPDAYHQKDEIVDYLKQSGLDVRFGKELEISEDVVRSIYKHQENADHFPALLDHLTDKPSYCFLISGPDAINTLRAKVGPMNPEEALEEQPDSIRAKFGTDTLKNAIHAPCETREYAPVLKKLFTEEELAHTVDWST